MDPPLRGSAASPLLGVTFPHADLATARQDATSSSNILTTAAASKKNQAVGPGTDAVREALAHLRSERENSGGIFGMQDLTALVKRLSEIIDRSGSWSITSDEVLALLGVDPVPFWRAIHGMRDRIGFADAIDGWTQDTAGDLVTVLEGLYGSRAEEALVEAGIFIPWSVGVGLTEELLFRARRLSAAHEVRTDELQAMIRHCGSVRGAVEIYLDAHIDIEALIGECADSFRILHGMPAAGGVTSAAWLRRMFSRHMLDRRSLLVGLVERLRIAAAFMGFIDPEESARARHGQVGRGPADSGRRGWALRVMGFSVADFTVEGLRMRYRELMMRHHPDVDPTGLELCKDVNVAYSLLISETASRP